MAFVRLPREWYGYYHTATMNFRPGTLTAPPVTRTPRYGWRFWHVDDDGLLWPPFASPRGYLTQQIPWADKALPADGVATADCPHGRTPAAPGCDCGLYFWPSADDMYRAVRLFEMVGRSRVVITFGEVNGPFQVDRTFYGLNMDDQFRGLRGNSYRVLCAVATIGCAMQWAYEQIPLKMYGTFPTELLGRITPDLHNTSLPFPDLKEIEKEYAV